MPPRRKESGRLGTIPERLRRPLLRCARGEQPANVALTHLLMAARNGAEIAAALDAASENAELWDRRETDHLCRLRDLWTGTPNALALVKEITGIVNHADGPHRREPAYWASVFDQAADVSTEASVALYSLGRADLSRAVTDELVSQMRVWKLLRPAYVTLDLGCGDGRIVEAISPDVRLAIGVDISRRLLAAARARCAACRNTFFMLSPGFDLALFAGEQFDAVYAVDSFPYLVQSGLAARHLQESARVLRPAGRLLIVNYSYVADSVGHSTEIRRYAREHGLRLVHCGSREFNLWDGVSFLLEKV